MLGPLVGGFLFERSLGHLLFSILGIGCIIAGVIYLSIDRYYQTKTANKVQLHQWGVFHPPMILVELIGFLASVISHL